VNGRATAVDEIVDYSLRTYLLVHQVSIKLILYYRDAYELLYRQVMRWIQNPFSAESNKEWPDLEELLIAASLVGIPWALMRESFVRKFLHNLIVLTPRREGSAHKQWLDHIFHNHKAAFHTILYMFSFFFTSSRPLVDLDSLYTRCAGTLPKSQRGDEGYGGFSRNGEHVPGSVVAFRNGYTNGRPRTHSEDWKFPFSSCY
jgi:hypothetical protein